MRDDRERLGDILEAVERIESYAARGREAFKDVPILKRKVQAILNTLDPHE